MWQAVARQRGQYHRGAIVCRYCRLGPLPLRKKYMRVSRWTHRLSAIGMLSPQAEQHTHIHMPPPPSEAVQYHSARKQPAPPAWILPLIPLHRPDWILAAKALWSARAGCRWVNRQWGAVCKPFSSLCRSGIRFEVAGVRESYLLKTIGGYLESCCLFESFQEKVNADCSCHLHFILLFYSFQWRKQRTQKDETEDFFGVGLGFSRCWIERLMCTSTPEKSSLKEQVPFVLLRTLASPLPVAVHWQCAALHLQLCKHHI